MTLTRCARCHQRYRGQVDWNAVFVAGVPVALVCSACQSPAEDAEAEANADTLDYTDAPIGRVVGRRKTSADGR